MAQAYNYEKYQSTGCTTGSFNNFYGLGDDVCSSAVSVSVFGNDVKDGNLSASARASTGGSIADSIAPFAEVETIAVAVDHSNGSIGTEARAFQTYSYTFNQIGTENVDDQFIPLSFDWIAYGSANNSRVFTIGTWGVSGGSLGANNGTFGSSDGFEGIYSDSGSESLYVAPDAEVSFYLEVYSVSEVDGRFGASASTGYGFIDPFLSIDPNWEYADMFSLELSLAEPTSVSSVSAVPEPSTYAMMLGGLGMIGFMASRRRKQA